MILSIVEIFILKKRKLYKEMILYSIMALITLVYGIVYFVNPYSFSFASMVFDLLKLK